MAASQMKLFGTTILFPQISETHFDSAITDDSGKEKEQSLCFEDSLCSSSISDENTKKLEESEFTKESNSSNDIEEVLKSSTPSIENPKTPSFETEPDLQNEHSEINSESPKKPDKILPCPRCDSADTKFCYYNNYNLTQPRYFCKNCQRYWTSGGTMRNVPVGSGRRKNKNVFDSQCCQIMAPEYFQSSQAYGEVLDFGSNTPKSFVSRQNFDLRSQNCFQNGFLVSQRKELSSRENGDDRSSITSSGSIGKEEKNNYVIQESVDIRNFQKNLPMMFYQSQGNLSFPFFYPQNSNSQILGKHSRERDVISNLEENNLWYPKASRIDDSNEKAKRSMWSSLGIKNEKCGIKGKVILEAFKSTENDEQYVGDNSLVLQANPAALARSCNFHEIV